MKKQNKNYYLGLFYTIIGLLVGIGPKTVFPVCPLTEAKIMKCWWTSQAEIGIGLILVAIGIFIFFSKHEKMIKSGVILSIPVAITGILLPATLIGGCMKTDMACRTTAFPALYVILGLCIIVSLVNILFVKSNNNEDKK